MVPRKFNIVEFGGFDLAEQYGEALPGIYDKIVDAHWNCVYIMCFGLKFGGFNIAPQYMTPEMFSDYIMLNGIISIDRNDIITIPGIEPPAPSPVIQPLIVTENRVYEIPEGIDGFGPVTGNVPNVPPDKIIIKASPGNDYNAYIQMLDSNLSVFNPDWSIPFEFGVTFLVQVASSNSQVLYGPLSGYDATPTFEVQSAGSSNLFWFGISNGTAQAYSGAIPKTEYPEYLNKWFHVKMFYDGENGGIVVTDGVREVSRISVLSFTPASTKASFALGGINRSQWHYPQYVLFDMSNTYFKQNGNIIWGNSLD